MEIFIILVLLAFLVIEGVNNHRIHEVLKEIDKPKPRISKEDKDKMERMRASFENLMEYDEEIAMKRK